MEGCFIVFEGIDRSGKTNQINLLKNKLKKLNYEVVATKEPTDSSSIGRAIQEVLRKEETTTNEALALLFAADRANHTRKLILPSLKKNAVVLSDRYIFSSLAYQSTGITQINLDWLKTINKFTLQPDLVIFLDISPETGIRRLKKGQKRVVDDSYFESLKKQSRIRDAYHKILNLKVIISELTEFQELKQRRKINTNIQSRINGTVVLKIDGEGTIDDIHKEISSFVVKYLSRKKIPKKVKKVELAASFLINTPKKPVNPI